MAKQAKALTALEVGRITRPGLYFDRAGLYLQCTGPDAKSWLYRYQLKGKQRWFGLGSAKDVSLKEARERRDIARAQIAKGVDPVAEKQAARQAVQASNNPAVRFRSAVETYLETHHKEWSNPKHRAQWRSTLQAYACPVIGDLPVNEINAAHIVKILKPIWIEKNETARRVRSRIEAVLDYAADVTDTGYSNPAALTERLKKALPKTRRRPEHHAALPYNEMASFMADLRTRESIAARALEFTVLTAARTTEVLEATWEEIDFDAKVWTISAERMKARKEHRVPLSDPAFAVVEYMFSIRQNDFIFPGMKPGRALSDMAMLKTLERLGRPDLTVHGFRSTFRDWATDQPLPISGIREVAEAALAHQLKDKTERAYARSDLFDKRRELMALWSTYCEHGDWRRQGRHHSNARTPIPA